jgi:hypothetical protein
MELAREKHSSLFWPPGQDEIQKMFYKIVKKPFFTNEKSK